MIEVTVKELASEIKVSVDSLIQQFSDAGIPKFADDVVSVQEKQILLSYLNNNLSTLSRKKLTLQRKKRCTLNVSSAGGKSKLIQIEVRKKQIIIQSNLQEIRSFTIENQLAFKPEEKITSQVKKPTEYEIQSKSKHKFSEKLKRKTSKKSRLSNYQINEYNKNKLEEKLKLNSKAAELKFKIEEETRSKLKKEASRIVEETRRIAKENKNSWSDNIDFTKESDNNHHIISYNAREAEEDNNCIAENYYKRNAKAIRSKKSNKYSEFKINNSKASYAAIYHSDNKKPYNSLIQQTFHKPIQIINRDVIIGKTITVNELANKMAVKSAEVIKNLIKLGIMANINQTLDQETAQLIAEEMGHKVILYDENKLEDIIMKNRNIGINTELRSPIVTIMGHVDHGKTSLLDYICSTKIALHELGGITQHIGAYHINTKDGSITFLDTPGHSAFTTMRARGSKITDIIVLVVAADDGVMPQTIEAVNHAKAEQVPIIVAINKIDKLNANPDRVKHDLAKLGVISEEWGGDHQFIYLSAKTGVGIDKLLNAIHIQAEIMDLKSISHGMASGVVIESSLDKTKGPIAMILVNEGVLNKGDIVLCGFEYGRIRAIYNQSEQEIIEAKPSIPVKILGLSGVPIAGDKITVVNDEKKARELALHRKNKLREIRLAHQQKLQSEKMLLNLKEKKIFELNIVVKADVQGSVEAINNAILKLSTNEIKVNIIGSGVGRISETDAILAVASKAILIGFNVHADTPAMRIIKAEKLNLRYHSVIYHLIDDVKSIMHNILSPKTTKHIIGYAEVRNVFRSPKFGTVAGSMVIEGTIKRHNYIRVIRNDTVLYEGKLDSLRRFKDDVNEVRNGTECGIGIKNYNNICTGDKIEVFEII